MLITTPGTNILSQDRFWEIDVSTTLLNFKHFASSSSPGESMSGFVSTTPQGWEAHPGWFVLIENEFRTWAYDGDRVLILQEETSEGARFKGTTYGDKFPCPIPAEVFSRLSEQKKKQLQNL